MGLALARSALSQEGHHRRNDQHGAQQAPRAGRGDRDRLSASRRASRRTWCGWPPPTTATSASADCSTTTTCSIGWPSCSSSTTTCAGASSRHLPLHHDRRVPGHQPDPGRAGAAARREPSQRDGGGRRCAVDLFVSRRQLPQHHGLSANLPRRARRQARRELSLATGHPRRRQRGHLARRREIHQGAVHRAPRRIPPAAGARAGRAHAIALCRRSASWSCARKASSWAKSRCCSARASTPSTSSWSCSAATSRSSSAAASSSSRPRTSRMCSRICG